jgi:aconitase B
MDYLSMPDRDRAKHFDARTKLARTILDHCQDLNDFAKKVLEYEPVNFETNAYARWLSNESAEMRKEAEDIILELDGYNEILQMEIAKLEQAIRGNYSDKTIDSVPHRILDFFNSLLGFNK